MNFLENCFQAPTLKSDKLLCKFVTDELPLVHYMPAFNQNLKPKNISEFLPLYLERPNQDNAGGMGINHSFALWSILRQIKPKLFVE
jgi:hypothetical protein